MIKHTPSVAIRTARDLQWDDAASGLEIALQHVQLLDGILELLDHQADAAPSNPLSEFVQASVMLAREAVANLRCGAEQARDNVQELQQGSGEVSR
jgi:hypothetical protein